jgi:L-aminopeptidase/D-esterase-like protein
VLTDVAGIAVGHWTDAVGQTGCTVVLLPDGTVAAGEVRGGAASTRGFSALVPGRGSGRLDAIVMAGGSAFGLAACDGAVRWLEAEGRGYQTAGGTIPIVAGMILYDLRVGDPSARPTAQSGHDACAAAGVDAFSTGRVGAGTGCSIDKWRGHEHRRPGGLGTATLRHGDLVVSAVIACNAWGGLRDGSEHPPVDLVPSPIEHTTIGVVATNALLDKVGCFVVAQQSHDGLARALDPVHTSADGDALIAVATGIVPATVTTVGTLAARAVEAAIRAACAQP